MGIFKSSEIFYDLKINIYIFSVFLLNYYSRGQQQQ